MEGHVCCSRSNVLLSVYHFERTGILNPVDEIHLIVLHYIYIPIINQALNMFTNGWNSHALSSANNKTNICQGHAFVETQEFSAC